MTITLETFIFAGGAILIPLAMFILNGALRFAFNKPVTPGTDAYVLIFGFDLTAITSMDNIRPLIQDQFMKGASPTIFALSMIFSLIFWLLSVSKLEPALESYRQNPTISFPRIRCNTIILLGWFFIALFTALNILVFTLKTTQISFLEFTL